MNLQQTIRRILREELSPRVKRRIDPDEMEKEFLESFDYAYDLTKRRKVLSTHFLDELIYTTISMMMDGFHWRFTSTLPEDEFWYDDIHTELENHYRDRITQMYNERRGINESILSEETSSHNGNESRIKKVFYGFQGLPNFWSDDYDKVVKDSYFDDKDYNDYYFDNFYDMDKEFGHEDSLFGTKGLPVGHPNRSSKSFDMYNDQYGPSIVRVVDEREGIYESILMEEKETEFSTPFKRRLGRFTSFVWDNNVINYPCDFENFDSFIHGIHAEVMDMVSDGSDTDGPLSDWLTYIDAIRYIQRYMLDDLKEYYNRECVNKKLRITNNVNESILREETEIPLFVRRRFSPEDLEWLVNDVKEMIDDGESLDTAIYDGVREFVKSRKFTDIDEFGLEADYWESYLRYERPLVDYVKKKLRITDNVNESILREEAQIPLPIKRRLSSSDLEEAFLISLDRIDYERRYSKMSIIKNASLQTFAKMVIDDMVTELEQEYFNDENRIYFDNDETYHEEIRVPLMNYFSNRIKKRYGPKDAKIVCQECGWSWNLSDGGDDPYTCHKCHPENE